MYNNLRLTESLKKYIGIILIAIECLILIILYLKFPFSDALKIYTPLIFPCLSIVLVLFILSLYIYVKEHKRYNKNEYTLNENYILPKFDTDIIRKHDIIYLSTILNQRYPEKKDIILLIMQLIIKKSIYLSIYLDGDKYQYIIEKNNNTSYKLNEIEQDLMYFIFRDNNRKDLIKVIENVYKNIESKSILKKCKNQLNSIMYFSNGIHSKLYKIITLIISIPLIYVFFIFALPILLELVNSNLTNHAINTGLIICGIISIFLNFICFVFLKKINQKYQKDNNSFLFLVKIISLLLFILIVLFAFPKHEVFQFIIFSVYIIALMTIMMVYNTHLSLTDDELKLRKELIAIKKYLTNMDYLTDKSFGNIVTYDEYLMYGFLFNITIKVNKEFDIIQKELKSLIKEDAVSYLEINGIIR